MRKPYTSTTGQCPYCSGAVAVVDDSRPNKETVRCASCDLYATRMTGRENVYPHDDPEDPGSPCAKVVQLDLD